MREARNLKAPGLTEPAGARWRETDGGRVSGSAQAWLTALKWVGTILAITSATLMAANIGASGYGFIGFFLSSICWAVAGTMMREPSIMTLNFIYLGINLLGIVRWLL